MLMIFFSASLVVLGQESVPIEIQKQKASYTGLSQKGEFHIGLQDLSTTSQIGGSFFSINPRIGYMMTHYDMIFLDARYTSQNEHYDGYRIEFNFNYRRYFGDTKLRFFLQANAGYGYSDFRYRPFNSEHIQNYYMLGTGAGVSYRYKRWTFEVGMKMEYNGNGSGRIEIQPMVGVSFSF